MATSLRELIVSVSADTTKYQREMDRASRMGAQYFRSVQDGGRTATSSWNTQTSAARTHANALEASTQAMTRYAAVAASAFGAARLLGLADEWTNISARVRLATESTEEFEHVQTRLRDIANETYRSYGEAADQFASSAQMMRELGFTTEDTLDSAQALGLALVAGGADAQRGASAMSAWTKSIALGRIDTEKWTTLMEQTPRVAQALAEGLGKTTVEMTEMARAGQLTADVVVPALISQMGQLSAEVESMPTEFRDAIGRLKNELLIFVGGVNDASGATDGLVKGIELIVEHIAVLATVGGGAAVGALAGKMIQIGQGAAAAAVGMVQSRMAAIAETVAIRDATAAGLAKAQADVRRAQAAMVSTRGTAASALASRNYANALLVERQASIAASRAQDAYTAATSRAAIAKRAALGILGGPAGLAVTVGLVAAGWLMFRDNTDAAETALANWNGTADEAVEKFRELNQAQQAGAMLAISREIEEASGRMNRAMGEMMERAALARGIDAPEYAAQLRELTEGFEAGTVTARQYGDGIAALNQRVTEGGRVGSSTAAVLVQQGEALANAAQEAENKRGILTRFNEVNGQAEGQADRTAAAVRGQALAFDLVGAAGETAGKRIQNALISLPGQIERMGMSAREVARLDVRDWFRGLAGQGVDFDDRENADVQALIDQGRQYIDLVTEQEARQQALAASTRALSAARKDAAEATAGDLHLERLNQGYADQVISLERQIALHGELGRAAAMAYDLANGALSGLAQSQKDYLQESAEWLDFLDDMAALEGVWAEVARDHAKYGEDAKQTLTSLEAFADQAARNMQSHLGDGLYNILSGRFDDISDSFGDMLRRMAAELLASEIWKQLGTALAGSTGQGWWGTLARGVGGAMTKDGGRAGGGPVSAFGAYDVTEHGDPELLQYGGRQVLLMGSKGGMVTPLMNRAGGGSSGASNVQISVEHKGEPLKVESASAQRGPDGSMVIRMMTRNEVRSMFADGSMDDIMRGFGGARQGVPYG